MTVAFAQCTEDEYMPRPGDINIGLPDDQIMQRYLVRRINREVEFLVKEKDGSETVGFITGFDDKCLQVSTTPEFDGDEPLSVLIFWPIARIAETGRRLDALDHENRAKIRSYSHALRAQCEAYLAGRAPSQRSNRSHLAEVTPTTDPPPASPVFSEA